MKVGKRSIALAVFGASLLGSSVASADPLTQLWFSQNSGFDSTGADGGLVLFDESGGDLIFNGFGDDTNADAPANTKESFSWSGARNPTVSSSILIQTYDTDAGTDATDVNGLDDGQRFNSTFGADTSADEWNEGDWWQISRLFQENNVLLINGTTFPNPLWIADAVSNLRIFDTSDHTAGSEVFLDTTTETISFYETLNTTGSSCTAGEAPLGTVCDDIFGVTASAFSPVQFDIGDYTYQLDFALVPGPSNPGPETTLICSALDLFDAEINGCDTLSAGLTNRMLDGELLVFTPENAPGTSEIQIYASWSVVPVPATLGLLGLGLLALGARSRKAA